jgi:hypothetical protein
MKAVASKMVRWIAGSIVVVGTCWNFWDASTSFGGLLPRDADELVVAERRFLPIRFALWDQGYLRGDVEYATARVLGGAAPGPQDTTHWPKFRYAAVPFNLAPGIKTAPYVVGDFTGGEPVLESPEGLTKLYDRGDGLVLYKRKTER